MLVGNVETIWKKVQCHDPNKNENSLQPLPHNERTDCKVRANMGAVCGVDGKKGRTR